MVERTGIITFQGNPLTLIGSEVNIGDRAPDFEVLDNDLSPVKFSSFQGKISIISSVPSLDTPVCDLETRKFNDIIGKLGQDVVMLTVSMDLPFAQKRWCGANGITNVRTFSDHRDASFGLSYGMLIKELRLLARAVFIVDKKGIIRNIQIVHEVVDEPDYDGVLSEVKKLV
jgi:thiol peroxidase